MYYAYHIHEPHTCVYHLMIVKLISLIQCRPGSGRGSIYGRSNPKALGPTTFIASGVFSIRLAGSTTIPTLMPYRIASVVIGSPDIEIIPCIR